ncbi:MAG: uroporphyrinogen decarboxylase family protein, partial [Clostridiales bacterium]|nr:uroporphyrinogen decarboxylase family protein [Clostridiales bacterium]
KRMFELKKHHEEGEVVIWISLEGFFWFPRTLLGIENHLYAFYDHGDLLHKINQDLAEYHIYVIEECCKMIKPDFMTFAEDMSYNHGPMISYGLFKEFLLPYYKKVVPVLKKHGIIPFVDSDGNVESMIPLFVEAGLEGVLPLERQAGVDVGKIRRDFPEFKMIGGYDKMVMSKGEGRMREEFERLLPVMKSGGFVAGCDHQTPPDVSLDNYKTYMKLMREYCEKAVK